MAVEIPSPNSITPRCTQSLLSHAVISAMLTIVNVGSNLDRNTLIMTGGMLVPSYARHCVMTKLKAIAILGNSIISLFRAPLAQPQCAPAFREFGRELPLAPRILRALRDQAY